MFARGEAFVEEAAPKVLVSYLTGHIDATMMRHLLEQFEGWRRVNGDDLMAFHDLEQVTDYDSEARLLVTPWARQHRPQFRCVHVLVRSQAIAWGIRVLGTLTDRLLVAHHDRTSFETARATATAARRALAG